MRCDTAGLLAEVVDPLGATTRYERDAYGRPASITDALRAVTRFAWTTEGELAHRIDADGSEQSWTYDGEGNCITHIDQIGGVTRYAYTQFDLLHARTGPDGVRYEFEHDATLRLTQVTNPQNLIWTYEYDAAGRLIRETDFDDRIQLYTHDAAGRLVSRTNSLGQTITFERNELGQALRKDADGKATTYEYDFTDQLARATNDDATLMLLRDRQGRLISETVNGRTLRHSYDELGRRTSRMTPTGTESTWAYDVLGNPMALTTHGHTLTFTHDAAGREASRHLGEVTFTSAYDTVGRLVDQTVNGTADRLVQHRAYTYRPDGYVTRIDDHLGGTRHYGLDATGRVTSVSAATWSESYAYDAVGNQTDASWPDAHPGAEARGLRTYEGTRITRAGAIRYEHDAAGRITIRQKTRLSRKPDTWRYSWDAEDRLTSVITPDGIIWRYHYDPLARRIDKQRLAADGETVVEQVDFTWDGTTLCEQTTHAEDTPNPVTLTWNHQGLKLLTQTERIGATETGQHAIDSRFFGVITDLVGAPTQLVNEEGTLAWHSRATLWGSTTWTKKSIAHTPLRFPGQYHDIETGLYYNFHRHYDPGAGRYASPDPMGLGAAPNSSSYVNNPHTICDPLGLMPAECKKVAYGKSKGEGQDLKRSATVGNDGWQFNTGHGFDRTHAGAQGVPNDLRTTGLTPDQIEQGIVNSVYDHIENGGTIPRVGPGFTGPLDGEMRIDGHSIGYRVSQTPDDVYRVATYWLNP